MNNMTQTEITSTQNDLIKYIVKLQNPKFRKSEKLILIDGEKSLFDIVQRKMEFIWLFIKKGDERFKNAKIKNLVYVNDEILKKISTTTSPTSAVGIIKEKNVDKNIFKNLSKIALIENIKDPGNLGTIIRSAAAFSIDGIILFGSCVDLYNSKVIRASAQNIFTLPILRTNDINFIKELKKNHKLISMVVDSKNDFMKHKFEKNFILAFGSEAEGLSEEIRQLSDINLSFFMDNNVESLNLALCSAISFSYIKYLN